ncbi:Na(+)/H(+) antiporter subunit F [Ammoniphilus oxalaticus]|uniref:Na(+)/H(+) antiporter subunit F n=1 Tax=Ammoniphilus oxalaticus TaxID=66863 RepID=A0A419SKQ7_9BACL|nr:Na(+)/H(+) antiporter subunit F1 [Ammoniphilus oxalaticus]RKD24498.1 Na(+)/H(+) antiporter subunit F [Ammoniphilus oxalaticus]
MFALCVNIALALISISVLAVSYRVFIGPSVPDRVIALDSIGINVVCFVAILSIKFDTHAFLDTILLIGILSFIGTTSFAKFLERGEVIVYDRHR